MSGALLLLGIAIGYDAPMKPSALQLEQVLGFGASDKRIDILRRIGQAGSISEAARGAGVSYKAAWQAIETLANLAGTPLVEKAVGGSGGGGAALTDAGRQVLDAADRLAQARRQVLERMASADAAAPTGASRAALALRTSMRNQFPCRIGTLRPQQGQVRVQLLLGDGGAVHSRITRESVQLLGLHSGMPVLALCKATAVRVAPQIRSGAGRNVLVGTVTRASRAAGGGEVGLRLGDGVQLVGFAEAGHGLKTGQPAMAAVDESGVVIASLD